MRGLAGGRLADIYVGVDVFARGSVVGGRFDTNKVGGGLRAFYGPWFSSGPLSHLSSKEREAAVNLLRVGKPRHQETSVCPRALTPTRFRGQTILFRQVLTDKHPGLPRPHLGWLLLPFG